MDSESSSDSDVEVISDSVSGNIEEEEEQCAEWLAKVKKKEKELMEVRKTYDFHKKRLQALLKDKRLNENREKMQNSVNQIHKNWIERKFKWSETITDVLQNTFKINTFRPTQLAAINATLSKKDVILLMPTGGGKSLTYQLPAVVDEGFTVVVSPLISLIEDQLINIHKLKINAVCIHGSTPPQKTKEIYKEISDKNCSIKILFLTPEMLAKSKRSMMYLKKAHEAGLISRFVVDEVHCCSTWGHDFRPDYKFLGIVRQALVGVPFLGLTATATSDVISDIQEVLWLKNDCLIFTAAFNRPNLYYDVISKPASSKKCVEFLVQLIQEKFAGESGIIYTNTVNECVTLADDLKAKGFKVGPYHAKMEPDQKKKVHEKWLAKTYQVVVATVAFGMGIDKPDVRFVIHQTIPRSIEGLYQESGRAGRDGLKAHCIVLFNLNDYLKILANISSVTHENKAISVLEYCLDHQRCRREILSKHFEEVWDSSHCNKMCNNCSKKRVFYTYYVTDICRDLHEIIAASKDQLTLNKVLDRWFKNAKNKCKLAASALTRTQVEEIVGVLLFKKYLSIERGYTLYNAICYIQQGIQIEDSIQMVTPEKYLGIPKKELLREHNVSPGPSRKRVKHGCIVETEMSD